MFDWNDEELANIIWGEADEGDDHIVPYPDGSEERPQDLYRDHIKKEWNRQAAKVKPAEEKKPVAKSELNGGKLEKNSQYDTNEVLPAAGLGVDSWPDLSLSNAAKIDQDSMDEPAGLDNGSEIFQNQHENKEESDLVDGWANIGSFDDLDRIFSNDDPVYGHVRLGNADELWPSSKDVTSSPEKSVSLSMDSPSLWSRASRSTSEHFGKAEYVLDQYPPLNPGYEKVNDLTCHVPQNVQPSMDHLGHAGMNSKLFVKDKMRRQLLKSRKRSEEKSEARQLQDLCGTWSSFGNQFLQFDGQYTQVGQASPSPGPSQQMLLHRPESLQYKHFSTPLLAPSVPANMGNQGPAIPVLPRFHSGEGNRKVPSGSEVSPGSSNPLNKFPDTLLKPLTMTPQEKIEKLRRRQQMRAMLAIQKQQQQFSHQVSGYECSVSQKYSNDNQMQLLEGGNFEVDDCPSTLPYLDPKSPIEQDESSTISMTIDNCSLEDTILHRLQDIVAQLDIQLRLCIRDSLFRLAQSAMQRQYVCDTRSTNKSSRDDLEFLANEETNSHNRFLRMPNAETDTNPIDRTVAHLLFHRPLELSGKLPEAPESPASAKLPCERKATSLLSSPRRVWPDNSKSKETRSHLVSKIPSVFAEGEKFKSCSCVNTSDNASNCEAGHGRATEVEAS